MAFDFASAIPRIAYAFVPLTPLLPWAITTRPSPVKGAAGVVRSIVAIICVIAVAVASLLPDVRAFGLVAVAAGACLGGMMLVEVGRASFDRRRHAPLMLLVGSIAIAVIVTRDISLDPSRMRQALGGSIGWLAAIAPAKIARWIRVATWFVVALTAMLVIVPRIEERHRPRFRDVVRIVISSLRTIFGSRSTASTTTLLARAPSPSFDFPATWAAVFEIARSITRRFGPTLGGAASFFVVLRLAVRGSLPSWMAGGLASAFLIATVAFGFRAFATTTRPLHRRHGFWVVVIATLVALPTLGTSGLVDPWETHYAEVAREMIERRDWISPWWANEGWFMSKPVLTFWLEGISMVAFGVRTGGDQVLLHDAHPEWAIRLPHFALALVGSYLLYNGVARTISRRAGFIGALALWTMPGFALLSHQAMTDMPLVACVAGALGLLLRAISTNDAVPAHPYLRYGLALLVALVTLPQIAMLALSHVHLDALGIHFRADHLVAGSPYACGLPSQPACISALPAHPRLAPILQAGIWLPISVWLIERVASERRASRLFAIGAWIFAAGAAMAKGPAGLAIPIAGVIVYALAKRSLRSILRLEIIVGVLIAIVMIAPWYLAAYARHGRHFIDELVMRHMLGRTLDHLHDTNDGEDTGIVYFIKQLGYATFPWSGIAAFATLSVVRTSHTDERSRHGLTKALLFGAAISSFTLVSTMGTKFHHYILIALPPIAMLTGIFVDQALSILHLPSRGHRLRSRTTWIAGIAVASTMITGLVARDVASTPARFIRLLTYRYARLWPSASSSLITSVLIVIGVASALAMFAIFLRRLRTTASIAFGAASIALSLVLLDLYLPACTRDGGQRDVIAAFYADRSPNDRSPLIAYQLNWKGENFYTGNHLAIFISSGAPMKTYIDKRLLTVPNDRSFYFVTERGRVPGLRREIAPLSPTSVAELTPVSVSAEFSLVRVRL